MVMLYNTSLSLVIRSRPLKNMSIRWGGRSLFDICLQLLLFCIYIYKAEENPKFTQQ